jgi:signal transduction histidine kinase
MIENHSQDEAVRNIRRIRHEMNNAMTALLGNTQMLLLRGNLDEKSRERVVKIEEQARRIRELVAELKEE